MNKNKPYQKRSKSFEQLDYKQQAQAMNIRRLNLKKMETAHERRKRELGK